METLTEDQMKAVVEAVRSMPPGYRPEDVADELELDWRSSFER